MPSQAQKSLQRLKPRLEPILADMPPEAQTRFWQRIEENFPRAFNLLLQIYGTQYDFFYHLEIILTVIAQAYTARSQNLHTLDEQRAANSDWFQSQEMVAGVCYVDLFADNLAGIEEKIPYFEELGLTYLHLMPLFKSPEMNDGGYAVSSYRELDPALGTMDQLRHLSATLREKGISLALDFVFNHTSDEHSWAKKALAGDEDHQAYYLMFPDRTLPDQYQAHLREIFPERAPGAFTYRPEIERWVWTTFYPFQWDLNYANPAVFAVILAEMLFLANAGVEILRLDAVPFIWKELGTACENLPQAHTIIQALNALMRIAAPALLFKSEAIVHPDDVAKYFGEGEQAGLECQLSYNPTLMALLWETLATREVRLLQYAMERRFKIPPNCAWINYVRVHDDIGWSFADEDAQALWIDPYGHRQFLNAFYTGNFPGSFARGLLFNFNPVNRDGRINGTCASLAGLEQALNSGDTVELELAIRRIILLYSIVLSIGGIPLIYLGDELGTLNDYSYQQDENKQDDSRWVHRPPFNWKRAKNRHNPETVEGRIFTALTHLIQLRKNHPIFAGHNTQFIETGNSHVLGYIHWQGAEGLLVLANFSEQAQEIELIRFRTYGLPLKMCGIIENNLFNLSRTFSLQPYQFLWLVT